ncbi:dicarboxylate/amino acid:cation symporter [Haploplasma axanthum]|uniref:L-cystine uptake protein TcyP n=1 Tax=Haploplasma axanthum TaxID=29552 RepID=A0A449BEV7_HAPAX|nr:dicarboxylate/amino acid:cation symporter [Haploplasma axanthum]VEU80993.1 Transporter of cystine tcyP [Haploplasma axanthum]
MFNNYKIDSWQKLVLYIVTILVIGFLFYTGSKKWKFSIRVLIGMGLGILVGLTLGQTTSPYTSNGSTSDLTIIRVIKPIGDLYLKLIQMVIMPLVLTAIIKSFTTLESTDKLKKIGVKTLFWLLLTTAIATIIGFAFASIFSLGKGYEVGTRTPPTIVPIENVILNFFPNNIFTALSGNVAIPVVIFALFVSIAIIIEKKRHPERVKPFVEFNNSLNAIMVRVTKIVLKMTPYAVFTFMAYAVGRNNFETLKMLGKYILIIYLAMFVHFVIVQMGLLAAHGISPFKFIRKYWSAMTVAFLTQSSYGTMPVSIKALTEDVGVSDRVANFVAPIGANVGMNACGGIFPAMVAVITANVFGIDFDIVKVLLLVLITTISSIGIAGVPGIATIAATVTLSALGLPIEGIAIVFAVDALVDMGRTMINVTGAGVTAVLVAKSENELDMEKLNSK